MNQFRELRRTLEAYIKEYSFMAHPETLLPMAAIDDPVERFVAVVKFYLSGWHIKPPYVHLLSVSLRSLETKFNQVAGVSRSL